MQGTGPVDSVDLNQYNLQSLDEILDNWRLNLKQKPAENEVNVVLDARNPEYFVDDVIVSYPRLPGQGLGIQLAELAGGRDDGLGITTVTGVVPGGPADEALVDIWAGDVIGKVAVRRRQRLQQTDKLSDQEEFVEAKTEGETLCACAGSGI